MPVAVQGMIGWEVSLDKFRVACASGPFSGSYSDSCPRAPFWKASNSPWVSRPPLEFIGAL